MKNLNLWPCECSDPGCPVHPGKDSCPVLHTLTTFTVLHRSDMEDETGTLFCDACAEDAYDSGLFYSRKG